MGDNCYKINLLNNHNKIIIEVKASMSEITLDKPSIDFKSLRIDDHAVLRAKQRFKRKDEKDALNYCKCLLGNSKYLGETTCDRGNRAQMFVAPNNVAIYLTIDFCTIKTLMRIEEKSYIVYDREDTASVKDKEQHVFSQIKSIPLQDKLIKLYQTEFKKHDRLEKRMIKEFTEFKLQKDIEIANLRLEQFKTRGETKKSDIQNKIDSYEAAIDYNQVELKKIQDDKRQISRALATLLGS